MPEIVIIFLWTITLLLAHDEGRLSAENPTTDSESRRTLTPDWLRLWYQIFHSDLQWAKDRSVQAVRFAVLLTGGLLAAKRYNAFGPIAAGWFIAMVVAIGLVSMWHVIDLHRFAIQARKGYYLILDDLKGSGDYIPRRRWDPHHVGLLIIKLLMVGVAAALGVLGLLSLREVPAV